MNPQARSIKVTLFACVAWFALSACSTETALRGDGLERAKLTDEVRADYDVFAQRCSKCHSLSRPLESGIDSDAFWKKYVERMRRQPGSGITQGDAQVILRFLHYYSLEQKRAKGAGT